MENKELLTIPFKGKITEITAEDDLLKIVADGELIIKAVHESDCCEHVWADFGVFSHYKKNILGVDLEYVTIKQVEKMGVLLCFKQNNYSYTENIFVPCYNEQNGYYSSELRLEIEHNGVKQSVDISEAVEDKID